MFLVSYFLADCPPSKNGTIIFGVLQTAFHQLLISSVFSDFVIYGSVFRWRFPPKNDSRLHYKSRSAVGLSLRKKYTWTSFRFQNVETHHQMKSERLTFLPNSTTDGAFISPDTCPADSLHSIRICVTSRDDEERRSRAVYDVSATMISIYNGNFYRGEHSFSETHTGGFHN